MRVDNAQPINVSSVRYLLHKQIIRLFKTPSGKDTSVSNWVINLRKELLLQV
jgi:hypothetical protein